jgi:alpha-mannosidase
VFDQLHRVAVPLSRRLSLAATFLCTMLFWHSIGVAQQNERTREFDHPGPQQTAAALSALSPQSRRVIERLSKLDELPAPNWKYRTGDVQDGQSVSLNESSWQEIQTPYRTNTAGVVWLRAQIEVPKTLDGYDLTGARLWIQGWRNDGLSLFFNGERVAEGDGMEPLVLFSSAKPGDKILVAVRLGITSRPKTIPAIRVRIDFAPSRPSPADMYTEFISAALLIPDLAKTVSEETNTLDRAIEDVDLKALDAGDQKSFDDSLRKSQIDLQPIKPTLQQATFHLTGNSHIDAAWLWPWTETVDVVRRTFSTALQLMDEYPTYTYTQSALQYNEWMAEKYPEMNAEIKRRIQEGRWEVVGGMWVEPDLNMPDGESQVRQLLVGQRTLQKLYGITTRIGWNPDTFGYDWQLPQIYKKSGMDYFVTQKLSANETNPLPFKMFWWESPDGSKVLTYFPHSYGNHDLDPIRLSNDLVKARTLAPGMLQTMDLYGVGDHGGGPTRAMLDQGLHWMQPDKVVPQMQFGPAQSYFSGIETKIAANSPTWNYQAMGKGVAALPVPPQGEVSIPTWKDELYFEHHRGTYSTQANHKRNVRESEEWMLNAEKYSSLAWLDGAPYPATELTEAWKKVLFNQFHDLAAGSGIGIIYKDAQRDYDQVRWATQEASSKALQTIQSRIDTRAAGAVPILVFNPLGWERSGLVQVDVEMPAAATAGVSVLDGHNRVLPSEIVSTDSQTNTYRLAIQVKDVPSLGYEVLHVVPEKRPFSSDLKANGMTIENAFLRVTVDPSTGCITSLYDKKSNFESLAAGACGDQLQTFQDTPVTEDAWNIDPGTLDHPTPLTQADSVKLLENSPFRAVIRVSRTWQSSKFVQDITLYPDSDHVDIVNDIDWHETKVLLKATFPLAASSKMATYEIPYGTIERPTTRTNSWDEAKFEVSALRWADLGDGKHGFSLINEAKYGYDCKDNVLRLTLLRSPTYPDPNADRGRHRFSFALYPHAGDWKRALSVRHGYEYNYRLEAMQVQTHSGTLPLEHSFVAIKGDNVVLTAIKKAEDADALILRFYEWAGRDGEVQLNVPKGVTSATFTNLMEKPEGTPLNVANSEQVTVPVHPFSIVTVRFDYRHEQEPQQARE